MPALRVHDDFALYCYAGHFLFRCPASSTFPAVVDFLASGADDDIIEIAPSATYRSKQPSAARRELTSLTVRVVRVVLPNGEMAVYLTDLLDSATFSCEEIADLYRRRWEVELDQSYCLLCHRFYDNSGLGFGLVSSAV